MYAISRAIHDHASTNALALMSLNIILLIIHYIMERRSNDIKKLYEVIKSGEDPTNIKNTVRLTLNANILHYRIKKVYSYT